MPPQTTSCKPIGKKGCIAQALRPRSGPRPSCTNIRIPTTWLKLECEHASCATTLIASRFKRRTNRCDRCHVDHPHSQPRSARTGLRAPPPEAHAAPAPERRRGSHREECMELPGCQFEDDSWLALSPMSAEECSCAEQDYDPDLGGGGGLELPGADEEGCRWCSCAAVCHQSTATRACAPTHPTCVAERGKPGPTETPQQRHHLQRSMHACALGMAPGLNQTSPRTMKQLSEQ